MPYSCEKCGSHLVMYDLTPEVTLRSTMWVLLVCQGCGSPYYYDNVIKYQRVRIELPRWTL